MTDENKAIFFKYAAENIPMESCALLIIEKGQERIVLARNKSSRPDEFILDPADYLQAQRRGEIVGIVHSHIYLSPAPSEADRVACEASGIGWHICSVPNGNWHSFEPSGYRAPLIGRQWAHAILDCYSLVRDYYLENLNITLPDFERENEWWMKGFNLFNSQNIKDAGFVEVSDVQKHDVLLIGVRSDIVNHAGIYLGDDLLLHHLHQRLSSRDVYGGFYRKNTFKIVRHESQCA